jgi:hypothetical protein
MQRLLLAAILAGASFSGPAVVSRSTVFVGSTPCDESIRTILGIPREANAELIEWELTLEEAADARAGATYHLRYKFGPTRANQPGLDSTAPTLERSGSWRIETPAEGQRAAAVVTLEKGLSLLKVSDTILHVLAPDRTLMVGNGGWSYTLSRRDAVERPVDSGLAAADSGDPARTTSHETGPSVLAIFDGRTPCQGIAREIGIAARPGCWKAKWRLTLLQDPKTRQPTVYRLEGTLYRSVPREGAWRITRGSRALPDAEVYELAPANGESPVLLLKGDDRVLFFLDRNRHPLTGTAGNAYTLDRRPS